MECLRWARKPTSILFCFFCFCVVGYEAASMLNIKRSWRSYKVAAGEVPAREGRAARLKAKNMEGCPCISPAWQGCSHLAAGAKQEGRRG